jgi:Secretion system C-terminal sorting domain
LLTYVAQKNLYNLQKTDNLYIISDPSLQSFFNTADAPTSSYNKLWKIEDAIAQEDYSTAAALIASFGATNEIEQNYLTYFTLYIAIIRDDQRTIANQNALNYLANLCPHTQGNIIYNARGLYNRIFTSDFKVYQDNCDGPGLYKKDNTVKVINQTPTNNFTASIYPNPNDGNMYIQTNLTIDEVIEIAVTDLSGKLLQTNRCNTSNSGCNLNMLSFVKGIYFVTITNSKHEKIVQKIILQ